MFKTVVEFLLGLLLFLVYYESVIFRNTYTAL
jgi:hypothetical protein